MSSILGTMTIPPPMCASILTKQGKSMSCEIDLSEESNSTESIFKSVPNDAT